MKHPVEIATWTIEHLTSLLIALWIVWLVLLLNAVLARVGR